ncbi:unnamed protein product [Phytophthora lilii]|uniref:Unnamed protein product n=1 Tax=Phytophthora lilii TaxID=2077276 RepID=A0A9W6TM11_9STRA|nr:unnamed protein product [Phytophthora lilii]
MPRGHFHRTAIAARDHSTTRLPAVLFAGPSLVPDLTRFIVEIARYSWQDKLPAPASSQQQRQQQHQTTNSNNHEMLFPPRKCCTCKRRSGQVALSSFPPHATYVHSRNIKSLAQLNRTIAPRRPPLMLVSRRATSALRRCRAPLRGAFSSSPDASKHPVAEAAAKPKKILSVRASPAQNLRNALEALDEMIEEADRKVEKKYRPNMFAEFKQLNDTEGKVLEGADKLIEVGKALNVPSLQVDTLEGKRVDLQSFVTKGKVTLVLTAFKNYGLDMLPAWRDGFVAAMSDGKGKVNANVQTLALNVIEDWYMKLVSGSITRGLQEKIPKELHATTFAHFGRCDEFRTPMALDNSFVGYAHLVDGKGRIRWM